MSRLLLISLTTSNKMKNYSSLYYTLPLSQLSFLLVFSSLVSCQLDYNFYDRTCPNLFRIVRYDVFSAISNDTRMAASLLRLHFHDCIVNGCDGSVLLDGNEKNALPNRNSLRGFEVIDAIKADLERACPGTVSCTDVLALAAREAVFLSGGPGWNLQLGRRDALTASEAAANQQIPSPFEPLANITAKFTSKGLDLKDVVVLSGGHTLGFAQCFTFKGRLFDFGGTGKPDPSLDTSLLQNLQSVCPNQVTSDSNLAPLDTATPRRFDNYYHKLVVNNSGLLQSDQALMGDSNAASMVINYSKYPYLFNREFAASMVKMANIGVLAGQQGEIRRNCRMVN